MIERKYKYRDVGNSRYAYSYLPVYDPKTKNTKHVENRYEGKVMPDGTVQKASKATAPIVEILNHGDFVLLEALFRTTGTVDGLNPDDIMLAVTILKMLIGSRQPSYVGLDSTASSDDHTGVDSRRLVSSMIEKIGAQESRFTISAAEKLQGYSIRFGVPVLLSWETSTTTWGLSVPQSSEHLVLGEITQEGKLNVSASSGTARRKVPDESIMIHMTHHLSHQTLKQLVGKKRAFGVVALNTDKEIRSLIHEPASSKSGGKQTLIRSMFDDQLKTISFGGKEIHYQILNNHRLPDIDDEEWFLKNMAGGNLLSGEAVIPKKLIYITNTEVRHSSLLFAFQTQERLRSAAAVFKKTAGVILRWLNEDSSAAKKTTEGLMNLFLRALSIDFYAMNTSATYTQLGSKSDWPSLPLIEALERVASVKKIKYEGTDNYRIFDPGNILPGLAKQLGITFQFD